MASARASSRPCAGLPDSIANLTIRRCTTRQALAIGMRAIRGADHDEARDAIGITLAERQRDHAAVRRAGNRAQAGDAEVIDEAQQQLGLVVCGDGGERRAIARSGGIGAGAQVVEAQDAEALRVERRPGPTTSCHQPPRGSSGSQTRRDGGNAADRHHHGRARGTREPPGDGDGFERAAEVQLELARHGEHAFAHLQSAYRRRSARGAVRLRKTCCRCSSNAPTQLSEHSR